MVIGDPRANEEFHSDERRVIGFDRYDRRIQRELGPIHLRYVLHGAFSPMDNNYSRMKRWTGANEQISNPRLSFLSEIELVGRLADATLEFIQEFGISGHVTVISPPRSCPNNSNSCSREAHEEHIGYMVGGHVSDAIRTGTACQVSHVMSFDMYECNFPSVGSGWWPQKAYQKYGNWVDEIDEGARDSIKSSSLIIICDDTMISYMSMMRIAISVRMYNQEARILCAGVFGAIVPLISNGYSNDYPESLYGTLNQAVGSQDGR